MDSFFKRTGLEQTTGDLSSRWQQDGSALVRSSSNLAAAGVIYTVSSNKRRYYVTRLYFKQDSGFGGATVSVTDGLGGDTIIGKKVIADNGSKEWLLDPPAEFKESLYVVEEAGNIQFGDAAYNGVEIEGWEE